MSNFRYRSIQILIALAFLAILGRLFQFQILNGQKYSAYIKRYGQTYKISPARAEIVDRNDKVLALDLMKYTLEYNPVSTSEDRGMLAFRLEQIIDLKNPEDLKARYSKTLAHGLSREQANKIRKLDSKLLYLRQVRRRFYPQDELASHVLGYVDLYGQARQGLEVDYQKRLEEDPEHKLKLSLDSRLQVFAEKELKKRIAETKATRGTVLLMEVATGQMMAMATSPGFNPNNYFNFSLSRIKNWPLVDVYQPGSIFKIVTVASALESGTIDLSHRFVDEGFLEIDKWKIKNHEYKLGETKVEELNLQNLFERSSNTFAAHLALAMGPKVFHEYIHKFGFGQKTGIELSGESKGILIKHKKWRNSDTATTGMGHGAISVTPLQLLAAVNVIANDGLWVSPTLFLDTKPLATDKSEPIISAENAYGVRSLLARAIDHNLKFKSSIAGRVDNLTIAGKTGTAEKIKEGGGYSKKATVASFLGFFPAYNPKYIALVVIDDPKTDGRWGDTVAGPLFNKIAAYTRDLYL